jgi:hypothetical protein
MSEYKEGGIYAYRDAINVLVIDRGTVLNKELGSGDVLDSVERRLEIVVSHVDIPA